MLRTSNSTVFAVALVALLGILDTARAERHIRIYNALTGQFEERVYDDNGNLITPTPSGRNRPQAPPRTAAEELRAEATSIRQARESLLRRQKKLVSDYRTAGQTGTRLQRELADLKRRETATAAARQVGIATTGGVSDNVLRREEGERAERRRIVRDVRQYNRTLDILKAEGREIDAESAKLDRRERALEEAKKIVTK